MDVEPGKKETEAPAEEVTPQEDTSQSEKKAEELKDKKSQADKVANKKSNGHIINDSGGGFNSDYCSDVATTETK